MTHGNRVLHGESAGGLPQYRQAYLLVRKIGRETIIEGASCRDLLPEIALRTRNRVTMRAPISMVSCAGFE